MTSPLPSPFTIFPAQLLAKAEADFWNFNQTGFSYPELSHRSAHYVNVSNRSQQLLKTYLQVPQNYEVLYLPTDAGCPSVPFNLNKVTKSRAIYLVRDASDEFAFGQAAKINPKTVKVTDETERQAAIGGFELGKEEEEESSFYTYYSLQSFLKGSRNPVLKPAKGEILVCNLNQCAYYETIDISTHGIVMFSSGHGLGLSGMDILIVRKDLIESHLPICPDMMDYKRTLTAKSVINTPFTLVPLMILHQLEYYNSLGETLSKAKQQLAEIKQEFLDSLSKHTEIGKTQTEGSLSLRYPSTMSVEQAQEYGTVDGPWLVLLLQVANKGAAETFTQLLFGKQ